MNCKQAQEFILTEYSDGLLTGGPLVDLQAHLAICGECRFLAEDIKRNVTEPLTHAPKLPVQEAMWRNIRDRIQDEKVTKALTPSLWENLKNLLWDFKPALIMASVFLIVGTVILTNYPHPQVATRTNAGTGESYVTYVMATDRVSDSVSNTIEQYFL
jgi:hypothetical protein